VVTPALPPVVVQNPYYPPGYYAGPAIVVTVAHGDQGRDYHRDHHNEDGRREDHDRQASSTVAPGVHPNSMQVGVPAGTTPVGVPRGTTPVGAPFGVTPVNGQPKPARPSSDSSQKRDRDRDQNR